MNHGDKNGKTSASESVTETKDYPPGLAAIKLLPPKLPSAAITPPEQCARKYPAFQELAAIKQEIHDEFLKGQLELNDIKGRLEEDITAVSDKEPAPCHLPAPQETIPEPQERTAVVPAASSSARRDAPEKTVPMNAAGSVIRGRAAIFYILALCAAAFAIFLFYAGNETAAHFPLPPTRAAGLCLDPAGERVFFSDPQRQLLFEVSASDGRIKYVRGFPAAGLTGLAFDGVFFWSSDGAAVYRHAAADNYAVQYVYKAAGASLICWDEGKLWTAAPAGGLHRYSAGTSLTQDETYPMPSGHTAGISATGGVLWLFDPESGKLSGYKLSAQLKPIQTADLKPWLPRKGAVSGFALRGNYLWLVTENPSELVRINLRNIKLSGAGPARVPR